MKQTDISEAQDILRLMTQQQRLVKFLAYTPQSCSS